MNKLSVFFLVTIITICVVAVFFGGELILDDFQKENAADIAWIITATCLVFLMTLDYRFFMVGWSVKNILSTMLKAMALGLISLIWVFVGFSLSFGDSFLG